VGALGGLGGFFPPLLLGFIRGWTGEYDLAFVLLSLFCVACLLLNYLVFRRRTARVGAPSLSP
jgi:NNP family nitrate/nitrite transporter-like MFS transporter